MSEQEMLERLAKHVKVVAERRPWMGFRVAAGGRVVDGAGKWVMSLRLVDGKVVASWPGGEGRVERAEVAETTYDLELDVDMTLESAAFER